MTATVTDAVLPGNRGGGGFPAPRLYSNSLLDNSIPGEERLGLPPWAPPGTLIRGGPCSSVEPGDQHACSQGVWGVSPLDSQRFRPAGLAGGHTEVWLWTLGQPGRWSSQLKGERDARGQWVLPSKPQKGFHPVPACPPLLCLHTHFSHGTIQSVPEWSVGYGTRPASQPLSPPLLRTAPGHTQDAQGQG